MLPHKWQLFWPKWKIFKDFSPYLSMQTFDSLLLWPNSTSEDHDLSKLESPDDAFTLVSAFQAECFLERFF